MSAEAAKECDVNSAGFANGQAFIFCDCGFVAKGDTWEEAGAEMDAHLDPEEDES